MVELDHFDVHIIQDDQPAKEHLDSQAEETATSATRYAEIREDKNFEIRLTVKETFRLDDFDALSVEITFDGEHAGALCYPRAHFTLGKPYTDSVAGFSKLVDGKTIMKNFYFAETATSLSQTKLLLLTANPHQDMSQATSNWMTFERDSKTRARFGLRSLECPDTHS